MKGTLPTSFIYTIIVLPEQPGTINEFHLSLQGGTAAE